MEKSELISIVTTFFNSKKYFEKTFESVISQSYKNWEWIIVDDCSKKSERDHLDSVTKKEKRIKVIHNGRQKGSVFSRSEALKKAKGTYIAFLNCGDYWTKDKLEKQLNFMVGNKRILCAGYFDIFDEKEGRVTELVKAPTKCTYGKLVRLDCVGFSTFMYKKSAFSELVIPESIKDCDDYAVMLTLSKNVPCYVIKERLATHVNFDDEYGLKNKWPHKTKHQRTMYAKLYKKFFFRSFLYAFRNWFYRLIRRMFYLVVYQNKADTLVVDKQTLENNNDLQIIDNCINCNFDKKIYSSSIKIPVFKAIVNEADLSSFAISIRDETFDLSSLVRVQFDVQNVGFFIFFVNDDKFNEQSLSKLIRPLKEERVKTKDEATKKVKELFNIVNNLHYVFAVYKAEGDHFLKDIDFSSVKAKALIILEYK